MGDSADRPKTECDTASRSVADFVSFGQSSVSATELQTLGKQLLDGPAVSAIELKFPEGRLSHGERSSNPSDSRAFEMAAGTRLNASLETKADLPPNRFPLLLGSAFPRLH